MGKMATYKSIVEMSLVTNKAETFPILKESILSIVIDSDFENKVMPVIYVTMTVDSNLYNTIIEHRNDARMYLNIKQFDANSSVRLYRDRVKGQFLYFVPKSYDYRVQLQDGNPHINNSYDRLTVGMIHQDILNFNNTTYNGMYNGVKTEDILNMLIDGRKFVMDNLDHSTIHTSFFFPPVKSRKEAINHLFSYDPFYDNVYIYFNDFDISYLIKKYNRRLKATTKIETVIFMVNKIDVASAFLEGMEKNLDTLSYNIYLNSSEIEYFRNDYMDKYNTSVTYVPYDGSTPFNKDLNITKNKNVKDNTRYVRTVTSGDTSIKDDIESKQTTIHIVKSNIDGSIITPNTIYKLANYNTNDSADNGNYTVIGKKEVIAKRDSEYTNTITISLRKLPKDVSYVI